MTTIIEQLEAFSAAGDREGYYNTLVSAGISYGALALDVVQRDSFGGSLREVIE